MNKITHWAGVLMLGIGFIPEILLMTGAVSIGAASISTQLGFNPTWFNISENYFVRVMTMVGNADPLIGASFVLVFTGLLLLILSDYMRYKPRVKS